MASKSVEDTWWRVDRATGEKVETANHGKGSRWRARYRDRAGKEHSRRFRLKTEAEQWLEEVITDLKTGRYVDPQKAKTRFRDYAEAWRADKLHSPNTEAQFANVLKLHVYPALGDLPLDQIRTSDIKRLVKAWDRTAAASTVHNRYTILATVLRAAVKDKVLAESPCDGISKTDLPRIRSSALLVPIDSQTVLDLAAAIEPRYRAFVLTGAGSGMRRSELLGLTNDRLSFDLGRIKVDRQAARTSTADEPTWAKTKTEASERIITVAPGVLNTIKEHVEEYGLHKSGLVFTTTIGSALRPGTLQRAWTIAAKEVGTDATPHALRHYYASEAIRSGMSIKALQRNLGHKSATETLDTYGHLMGDEDSRASDAIQAALFSSGAANLRPTPVTDVTPISASQ